MGQDLQGRRAIVFGVASDASIAWGIAKDLADRGATVTMGYQKRFLSRVMHLFKDTPWIEAWHECDAAKEDSVAAFFGNLEGEYDMLVHAIAYAPATALQDEVTKTTEEDFNVALDVSAYSLVRIVRHAMPRLRPNAAVLTLTYLGADRVVPGYRVMGTAKAALQQLVRELAVVCGRDGVRVNAISAGPIRTLAASGVPGFESILDWMAHSAPLKRNVDQDDVAKAAYFLLSPLASGVTGQTLYVDAGYSCVGVPPELDQITLPGQAAGQAKPILFGQKAD